ncbi:CLUMA_CG004598, isoform A [Clunio marinus]|uniref:CLUMA_CG004598, isoform A n=1 Tax=Clunio marinus TaxID=568069 RepID=A0A1J1HSC4_9DIPT|nr:CLUMA_CG004598, isoform A [Clunio marinus]
MWVDGKATNWVSDVLERRDDEDTKKKEKGQKRQLGMGIKRRNKKWENMLSCSATELPDSQRQENHLRTENKRLVVHREFSEVRSEGLLKSITINFPILYKQILFSEKSLDSYSKIFTVFYINMLMYLDIYSRKRNEKKKIEQGGSEKNRDDSEDNDEEEISILHCGPVGNRHQSREGEKPKKRKGQRIFQSTDPEKGARCGHKKASHFFHKYLKLMKPKELKLTNL